MAVASLRPRSVSRAAAPARGLVSRAAPRPAATQPLSASARNSAAFNGGALLRRSEAYTAATRRTRAVVVRAAYADGASDARIKVIGCGGGGGNAVNRMIMAGLQVLVKTYL